MKSEILATLVKDKELKWSLWDVKQCIIYKMKQYLRIVHTKTTEHVNSMYACLLKQSYYTQMHGSECLSDSLGSFTWN